MPTSPSDQEPLTETTRGWRSGWRPGAPEVTGALGLLALVALVVFGLVSRGASEGRSTAATPPLSWTRGTFLPGISIDSSGWGAEDWIAAADGNTAYACRPGNAGPSPTVGVWLTHDRAVHWQHLADLPSLAPENISCWMAVDTFVPTRVVLNMMVGANAESNTPQQGLTYLSEDGGAHWRRLANTEMYQYGHFATASAVTFADTTDGLAISRDGMFTWRVIDGSIQRAGQVVQAYWVRPETGELLAMGCYPRRIGCYLWR